MARSPQRKAVRKRSARVEQAPRVNLIRGDQVKIRAIGWLWKGWLAQRKLHIIAGTAGDGKSTIALSLAAALTTGGRWPDGSRAPFGEVIMWSGEDDVDDTLVPRFAACGGNREAIHFVNGFTEDGKKRAFDPSTDIPVLMQSMRKIESLKENLKLVIIDSIASVVAGDSHKNSEVRRALQPLIDLASKTGCAVLGISHFTKGTVGRNPLDRVTASLAFGALARLVWVTASSEDRTRRVFARAKSNLGPGEGGFEYSLVFKGIEGYEFAGEQSCIEWGDWIDASARTILSSVEEGKSAFDEAKDFLRDALENGEVTANELKEKAEKRSISWATLRLAQEKLKIKPRKVGFGSKSHWLWKLPGTSAAR